MPITIKNNPEDAGGVNNCIVITIPARGETGWADLVRAAFKKISQHDHTGNENGTQLGVASLEDGAVTKAKINANVAGEGLTKDATSGALNVKIDDVTIERDAPTNTLRLKDDGISPAKLSPDVAGLGLVQNGVDESLEVNVDDSTIEIDTDIVRVKDLGIVTAKLADAAITTAKLFNGSVTTDKIADDAVTAAKIPFISDTVATDAVQNDTLVWNATSGQFEPQAGGGGGGAAGINHVEEPDAESTLATWSASLSSDFNVTAETSTILRGLKSFRLRKAAKVVASPYVEVSFSIPNADLAKKHLISFDYDADDANYADGDIRLSVIKDPSGTPVEIRINGEDLRAGKGTHFAQFQTDHTETSYKLRFTYKNTTDSNLIDVFLDTVKVSPVGVNDSVSSQNVAAKYYTPANTPITSTSFNINFGTKAFDTHDIINSTGDELVIPVTGYYQINATLSLSATDQDSRLWWYLSKNSSFILYNKEVASFQNDVIDTLSTVEYLEKGDVLSLAGQVSGDSDTSFTIIGGGQRQTNISIAKIPDLSLPESVGSGRDIIGSFFLSANQGISGTSAVKVQFDTVDIDTVGAFIPSTTTDHTTGYYEIPETGYYDVNVQCEFDNVVTGDSQKIVIVKNTSTIVATTGVRAQSTSNTDTEHVALNGVFYFTKGDQIAVNADVDNDSDGYIVEATSSNVDTWFKIAKRQSAQTVLETETVAAKAKMTAAYTQSLPDNTDKTIQFNTTEFDTHGCLDLATYSLIAPITGYYQISANILISQITNASNDANIIWKIIKTSGGTSSNAIVCWESEVKNYNPVGNQYVRDNASTTIYMEKGDSIKLVFTDLSSDDSNSVYVNEDSFLTFARLK